MMLGGSLADDALATAALHLVGQSRAFVHQVEAAMEELAGLHDERTTQLLEALRLTLASPTRPGTLRQVEQSATALLRSLREP